MTVPTGKAAYVYDDVLSGHVLREGHPMRPVRLRHTYALLRAYGAFEDEHALVDWSRPARAVFNHVRGCDPAPGAIAALGETRVRLFDPSLAPARAALHLTGASVLAEEEYREAFRD